MTRRLAVTPFLTGDPLRLEGLTSLSGLLAALGLETAEPPALLAVGPRVALVFHRLDPLAPMSLRWVNLPAAPALDTTVGPADVAIVLTAGLRDSGTALRLAGRLRAGLRDTALLERAAAARNREELVAVLGALDESPGESPLSGDEVLGLLESGRAGLAAVEAARRLGACGANRLEQVRRRSLPLRLLDQFVSLFAVLLWVGGGFAFLAGMAKLGWAIFAVIIINGVFSFLQEYRAERALQALQELLPDEITVVRDGHELNRPAEELVPGDLVHLDEGDRVPADGQLLASDGLRVDQSTLTGEPHPAFKLPVDTNQRELVPRLERRELLFAGTAVAAGRGTCVVTATGMATEIGRIAHLTQAVAEEPSPLQREMAQVTRLVTALALALGVGFLVLGTATGLLRLTDGLVFALGVIVANVPEGLLPTLTLALALAVQRLARRRSLVKRLSAVEALGAITVICSDKTGTLTEGRMTARALWVAGRTIALDDTPARAPEASGLLEAAALASNATAERGDPTEVALLAAAVGLGLDPERVRADRPVLATYSFDSFRKRMTLTRADGPDAVAYIKGAPKETLALCATIRWDGTVVPLTEERRQALLSDHDRLAAQGLRLLAVAERPLPRELVGAPERQVERELTFLGLVALWDPPRPEVAEAVALCARAGIRTVIVTGDYGLTAQAIARQVGMRVDKVVTGEETERMRPETLRGLVREPGALFARTSPAHKLAVVQALRAAGEVVAVTGDGVNDAPALKAADIGVAMGRRGTDVAKEAAEVVLLDDNFASIVTAVREGRAIYANMGKFITYIFASNVPELVPFLLFVLLGVPLPLTLMQILAVDLGTDLLPALALGAEPPEPDVMDRPPRARDEKLLGPGRLLRAYGFLGLAEAALSLTGFFWTYWLAGWRPGLPMVRAGALYRRATTMTLAGIVAAQAGNVLACRSERESVFRVGLFTNPSVWWGIAAEVSILVGLIAVPPLREAFGLMPLAAAEWGILLLFPPGVLLLEEARKALVRRARPPATSGSGGRTSA